jgi:hypothetical protein
MVVLVATLGACAGPPLQAMSDARQMIAVAQAEQADRKAPEPFQAARAKLRTAENLLMSGDYKAAKGAAIDARENAARALATARAAARTD